ncbi:MAG: DUF3458 domain-containing protein, partial [Epsilonproteobacteria bacterium]|nr:DUF3458 domain-containing protein [Campylobacterota bacterium]
DDVKSLRERQFVEDASPTAHPIQPDSYIAINNFYTATVYEKGAEVIRMLYTLLGCEKFRAATDLYFATFDGQAVRTDDFLWSMREASGLDLSQFERWYHQSGTPTLVVEQSHEASEYKLTLTQKVPDAVDGSKQMPYYFPLKIALYNQEGSELLEETLIVSQESETFVFTCQEKPILSINRDFSAPIKVEFSACENLFLMKHDTNAFSRYEAAQNYAIATIERLMAGKGVDSAFVDAYGYLLGLDLDLSYKALLLELPNITTLMQRQEVVDFEPIYAAKEALELELATVHKAKLLELYNAFHMPSDDSLSAESMGKRALKNGVLKLLSTSKDEAVLQMAKEQYENSITMTDRIAALDILENNSASLSATALADFYARYKNDTLVMNKYFAILAASSREGVLDRVMALQNDPAYSEVVPNLVRSLIGVFARNYKYFHAKDGLGYKFIAQKVLDIDKINPQIASGLCSAFKIYEKLNRTNKDLMRTELECIVSTHSLSKNVYEIVSKILKK